MVTLKTTRRPIEPVNVTDESLPVGNGVTEEQEQERDDDVRSSSLSEIEDGLVDEHAQGPASLSSERQTDNDSEAETERLEPSPVKPRKHKDVILGSDTHGNVEGDPPESTTEDSAKPSSDSGLKEATMITNADEGISFILGAGQADAVQEAVPSENPLPTTTAAPHRVPSPPEIAGRKRKRHNLNGDSRSRSESREAGEPLAKRTGSIRSDINGEGSPEVIKVEQAITRIEVQGGIIPEKLENPAEAVGIVEQAVVVQKDSPSRRGRRKGTQHNPSELKAVEAAMSVSEEVDREGLDGGVDAHTPQVDTETVAEAEDEEEDVDTPAKNEEGMLKKRDAMESLTLIEKQFATFRDKLYEERLAQLDNELAQLAQPIPTHPEYLAKVQCIRARRDEKIRHEQTLYRYKVKTLQNSTLATRSQIQSEFCQTVRDIRERQLKEAGEQWYQIQRDRREWEKAVPDFTIKFPTRRSQQVMQQTAYNTEVSVLSGIAKHVGFPAAPEIEGARPSELDADLQAIG